MEDPDSLFLNDLFGDGLDNDSSLGSTITHIPMLSSGHDLSSSTSVTMPSRSEFDMPMSPEELMGWEAASNDGGMHPTAQQQQQAPALAGPGLQAAASAKAATAAASSKAPAKGRAGAASSTTTRSQAAAHSGGARQPGANASGGGGISGMGAPNMPSASMGGASWGGNTANFLNPDDGHWQSSGTNEHFTTEDQTSLLSHIDVTVTQDQHSSHTRISVTTANNGQAGRAPPQQATDSAPTDGAAGNSASRMTPTGASSIQRQQQMMHQQQQQQVAPFQRDQAKDSYTAYAQQQQQQVAMPSPHQQPHHLGNSVRTCVCLACKIVCEMLFAYVFACVLFLIPARLNGLR
jgi:hypothetical protein